MACNLWSCLCVAGAKVRTEIYEAFENIYPILKGFRKQQQRPACNTVLPSASRSLQTAVLFALECLLSLFVLRRLCERGEKVQRRQSSGSFQQHFCGFHRQELCCRAQHSLDDCLKSDRFKCLKVCKPYSCGMLVMGCWRFQTASCCICLRSAGKRPFLNIAVLVVPSV